MTMIEDAPVNSAEVPTSAGGNPIGFGRMLRKEDVRFVRGKGHYIDDVVLPGMLHGAILRSPHATRGSSRSTPAPPKLIQRYARLLPAKCSKR